MEAVGAISFFVMILLYGLITTHSVWRYFRLRSFIMDFYTSGVLTPEGYRRLTMQGMYFVFQSSPDMLEFRELYTNVRFLKFVERWRKIRNFYLMGIVVCFLLLVIAATV